MLVTHHQSIADLCVEFGVRNIVAQIPTSPLEFTDFIVGIALKRTYPTEVGLFTICEDRYVAKENYKIEFAPTNMRYGKERFYISDFDHLWREGHVRVFIIVQDGDVESYVRVAGPPGWDREDSSRKLDDWGHYRHIQQQMNFCLLPVPSSERF